MSDFSAPGPNFTVNFLEVKVKVQGQNHHTENLQTVIASLAVISPDLPVQQLLGTRSKSGVKYDLTKFKMGPGGGLQSRECFLVYIASYIQSDRFAVLFAIWVFIWIQTCP